MEEIQFQYIFVFFAEKEVVVFNKPLRDIKNDVDQQLNQDPKDIKFLLIKAQILHYYDNNYKQALQILKDVLILDPKCIDAKLDLVDIILYHKVGDEKYCSKLLDQCLLEDQLYWRIYFIQMKQFNRQSMPSQQIIYYAIQYLKLFPNNLWITTYYWQYLTDLNDNNIKLDLDLIIKSQYLDFEILRRLAYIVKDDENINFALKCEEQALKLNPESFHSLNNYGLSLNNLKEYDKSIQYFLKAIENNPRYLDPLENIGIAYGCTQKRNESNYYLKKHNELEKSSINVYEMIVNNSYHLQDFQSAYYYSQKAVNKFPESLIINLQYLDLIIQQSEDKIEDVEDFELKCFIALKKKIDVEIQQENNTTFINQNLLFIYEQHYD